MENFGIDDNLPTCDEPIVHSIFDMLKVTCGHCNARKLKLWPEAPDIKFACADPLCRLNNMVTILR